MRIAAVIAITLVVLRILWMVWQKVRGGDKPFRAVLVLTRVREWPEADRVREVLMGMGDNLEILSDSELVTEFRIRPTGFSQALKMHVSRGPGPYLPPGMTIEDLAAPIGELRLREALTDHRSWFSVVLDDEIDVAQTEEALGFAGRLAAALMPSSALVVWLTDSNRITLADEATTAAMKEGKVREVVTTPTFDPIVAVDSSSKEMRLAVAEARSRFSEFREFVLKLNDRERTIAKAPFSNGPHTEFMWLMVERIDGETIVGELANKPWNIPQLEEE